MKVVPYIVLAISFIPYFMAITFLVLGVNSYEKEKREKQLSSQE